MVCLCGSSTLVAAAEHRACGSRAHACSTARSLALAGGSSNQCLQVHVMCPAVDGSDTMNGQLLAVEVPSLLDTVGDLKQRLSGVLGVGANKLRLK